MCFNHAMLILTRKDCMDDGSASFTSLPLAKPTAVVPAQACGMANKNSVLLDGRSMLAL